MRNLHILLLIIIVVTIGALAGFMENLSTYDTIASVQKNRDNMST